MKVTEKVVEKKLRTVIDPELGINMVDLGLVYGVTVKSQKSKVTIEIVMTLTTPGCPLGGYFVERVKEAVAGLPGVEAEAVEVEITFDPPWTMEMMNEEAKANLGFD
jgi:metal-sulfur cluster biosynthetic enzyme